MLDKFLLKLKHFPSIYGTKPNLIIIKFRYSGDDFKSILIFLNNCGRKSKREEMGWGKISTLMKLYTHMVFKRTYKTARGSKPTRIYSI